MIIIREFQEDDAAEASVVYFRSFKNYLKERMDIEEPRPAEYWLNAMRHTVNSEAESISFVAEAGGKVIGCISITAALQRRLGHLNRIGVLPEYAGKGVGHMLFNAAEQFWTDRKMRKIYTCVSSINPNALKFYQNCGFHCEGMLKDHFFDGVDEYQMALFFH